MVFLSTKSVFIASLVVASHLTAYFLGYAANEKPKPNLSDLGNHSFSDNRPEKIISQDIQSTPKPKNSEYQAPHPLNFLNGNNLKTVVETMHPAQLNNYLSKYFDSDDLNKIGDQGAFAQRLIDLYSGEEKTLDHQQPTPKGEIAVATTIDYPLEKIDIFSIHKDARLYAHLKLDDSASLLSEVFIKWERVSDSKLLLFEKKLFDSSSYKNWVSIVPQGGWKDGEYRVSFYQFNTQMRKIASYSYFLNDITGSPES